MKSCTRGSAASLYLLGAEVCASQPVTKGRPMDRHPRTDVNGRSLADRLLSADGCRQIRRTACRSRCCDSLNRIDATPGRSSPTVKRSGADGDLRPGTSSSGIRCRISRPVGLAPRTLRQAGTGAAARHADQVAAVNALEASAITARAEQQRPARPVCGYRPTLPGDHDQQRAFGLVAAGPSKTLIITARQVQRHTTLAAGQEQF